MVPGEGFRGSRAGRVLLACTLLLAMTAVAQNFQPHASHQPPPPPAAPPPPPAPPKFPPPKVTKLVDPAYPPLALRYNAQKTVGLRISVNANGSVREIEVMNGDDEFGESAKRAAMKWKFEKRPDASTVRLAVPFKITSGEEYAFETKVRAMSFAPKAASDVKQALTYGFEYVRLMIDASGKVIGKFVESAQPDEFAASADAIIEAIKFSPSMIGIPPKGDATVNSFLIDYANDGVIRIQQRRGDPAW